MSKAAVLTSVLFTHASDQRLRPEVGSFLKFWHPEGPLHLRGDLTSRPRSACYILLMVSPEVIIHSHTCYQLLAYWLVRALRQRHGIQIWSTQRHKIAWHPPHNFNRAQAAMPGSRIRPLGLNSADFIGSFLWPPTITSAATWLSGGPNGGRGGVGAWDFLTGFTRLAVAQKDSGVYVQKLQWPHGPEEVINEVRHFFWWRRYSQKFWKVVTSICPSPANTLRQILYHMCSLTLAFSFSVALRCWLKCATSRKLYSLLLSILWGRIKQG